MEGDDTADGEGAIDGAAEGAGDRATDDATEGAAVVIDGTTAADDAAVVVGALHAARVPSSSGYAYNRQELVEFIICSFCTIHAGSLTSRPSAHHTHGSHTIHTLLPHLQGAVL